MKRTEISREEIRKLIAEKLGTEAENLTVYWDVEDGVFRGVIVDA